MNNLNCINFNNKIYFVKRNHNENNKYFIERMWYIINQKNLKENKNKSFNDIINMSNIYINKVKNECVFN